MATDAAVCSAFWSDSPEKGDLNQYWFSPPTIQLFVDEVVRYGPRAALVSCPSIYFSLPEGPCRDACNVLEFDTCWKGDPGFVFYDFNHPEDIPQELHHSFDLAVIDPPYITKEVWSKYAVTARLLLKEGCDPDTGKPRGRLLCTSIGENAPMLRELLGIEPRRFRPSIPNLVYQYHIYTNYDSPALMQHNPEIDPDGDVPMPGEQPTTAWQSTYGGGADRADEIAVGPGRQSATQMVEALESSSAVDEAEVDCGPVCNARIALRELLGELKKAISGLGPVLEALVRCRGSDKENQAQAAVASRDAALQRLVELASAVDGACDPPAEPSYATMIATIREGAQKQMEGKKEVMAFTSSTAKYTQRIFKHQTALLGEIKELKKQSRAAAAQAAG
eukprot:TRINITY_DN25318_c0_g1_i3.p1 TRINITY_DN25318_c0_g1~~TRINITY_DN25318_c0_g1_i3.p1  ORF type:complete len:392 (+),score=86.99 TRINITY_DN25318_c0_g1_i3:106-1281(+)